MHNENIKILITYRVKDGTLHKENLANGCHSLLPTKHDQ